MHKDGIYTVLKFAISRTDFSRLSSSSLTLMITIIHANFVTNLYALMIRQIALKFYNEITSFPFSSYLTST